MNIADALIACRKSIGVNKVKRKSEIITLCGSIRFKDDFLRMNRMLSLAGYIVLMPAFSYGESSENVTEYLEKLHRDKINLSDKICVINTDGYIGESTRKEIEYAKRNDKEIIYMEVQYEGK